MRASTLYASVASSSLAYTGRVQPRRSRRTRIRGSGHESASERKQSDGRTQDWILHSTYGDVWLPRHRTGRDSSRTCFRPSLPRWCFLCRLYDHHEFDERPRRHRGVDHRIVTRRPRLVRLGAWFGAERIEGFVERYQKYLSVTPGHVRKAHEWFERYGVYTVFFCRMVPIMRSIISIPAGLVRMNLLTFFRLHPPRFADLERGPRRRRGHAGRLVAPRLRVGRTLPRCRQGHRDHRRRWVWPSGSSGPSDTVERRAIFSCAALQSTRLEKARPASLSMYSRTSGGQLEINSANRSL